jgi:hypothetical protein
VINDALLASTVQEKRLANAGVPRALWNVTVDQCRLATCGFQRRKLSPREQRWHLHCLAQDPRQQLCCIATPGYDDAGLALAVGTVNAMHARVALIDSQWLPTSLEHYPRALILYNVLADAPAERIQAIRDACLRFGHAVRLLVVAGTRDPEGWCLHRLRLRPDGCCCCTAIKTTGAKS